MFVFFVVYIHLDFFLYKIGKTGVYTFSFLMQTEKFFWIKVETKNIKYTDIKIAQVSSNLDYIIGFYTRTWLKSR